MFSIALLGMAVVIVLEGGLSILGVGVPTSTPSWGNMIAVGRNELTKLVDPAPQVIFAPALCIFLTVLSLNYLGDVVRARFDVREAGEDESHRHLDGNRDLRETLFGVSLSRGSDWLPPRF